MGDHVNESASHGLGVGEPVPISRTTGPCTSWPLMFSDGQRKNYQGDARKDLRLQTSCPVVCWNASGELRVSVTGGGGV